MSRGRGEVKPVLDDDDERNYTKMDKPHRRGAPPPSLRRRVLPARWWLGWFLLINVIAIAGFIFSSAWYFPSPSTAGVMEQALKQGDMAILEVPRNDDGDAPFDNKNEPHATMALVTRVESPSSSRPPQQSPPTETPRLRSDADSKIKIPVSLVTNSSGGTTQPLGIVSEQPSPNPTTSTNAVTHDRTSTTPVTLETNSPRDSRTEPLQSRAPTVVTPCQPELTPPPPIIRSQSMEEALLRIKGGSKSPSPQPTGLLTVEPEATHELEQPTVTLAEAREEELQHEDNATTLRTRSEAKDLDLEGSLVAWLKADEGVEVENAAECEALGSACEVTAWKSVGGSHLDDIVFQPVNSRIRPILQPASQNQLPMVSFSCGMTHTSGLALREMMTLFFVLSPAQIEFGDTYAAQKFFGNAPYGQFLLHGGKPAFFTAAGLVETSFVGSNEQLLLITYRVHRHAVEIKPNRLAWSPKQLDNEAFSVRMSGNAAVSLGNVKNVCDTNAFQGRIAEVLVYDTILSDASVKAVEEYLDRKWWGKKLLGETTQIVGSDPTTADQTELVLEPLKTEVSDARNDKTSTTRSVPESVQPQDTQKLSPEGRDELTEDSPPQELTPRTFDPEGVFEWLPSSELLALIAKEKGTDPSALVVKWKQVVSEKIALVHNFQLGGEVLRSFIRERRDELLTLRDELFGE